jgi:hypothetical protein
MAFEAKNTSYVDADGSYGTGALITFDDNDLTDQQWETLSELRDNDKYDYVYAIMSGEPLDEWEDEDE